MRRLLGYIAALVLSMMLSSPVVLAANSNYPPPYTGGAPVAKFFHLPDGSTVTITSTGAVIKQGQNGNPYREGWICTSDINNIRVYQQLNGQLMSGSTNPCTSNTISNSNNTSSTQPEQPQVQTQTQAQTVTVASTTPTVTTASAPSPASAPQPQSPTSSVTTLPNTGAGGVITLAAIATVLGTLGHYFYRARRRF